MRESEYSKVGSVMDRGSMGRGSSGSWVVLLMGHMGHGSSNVTHCLLCWSVLTTAKSAIKSRTVRAKKEMSTEHQ
jgi:hypothetical protein